MAAVVGTPASHELGHLVDQPGSAGSTDGQHLDVDTSQGSPWVRLAVIRALDRWLHLPLEQALLQAETGVAMLKAADGLPEGSDVRGTVIGDALVWARRAAEGLTRFLHDLDTFRRPLPLALHRSVRDLVEGYRALRAHVDEPDGELDAVVTGWQALASDRPADANGDHHGRQRSAVTDYAVSTRLSTRVASMIDPRHVRARVLDLGSQARAGEISLTKAFSQGQEAVQVRVAAFERWVDPEIAQRLMARLVNRRSGRAISYAPLEVRAGSPTMSRQPFFECTMPLRDPLEDVRADVFDALFPTQPAAGDTEDDLLRVRRCGPPAPGVARPRGP